MRLETSDAGPGQALADFLLQLAVVGAVAFVTVALVLGLTLWLVVRKVRRSGVWGRATESGSMALRLYSSDSSVRRLARLRRDLHRSIQATERSLAAAYAAGRPVGELPAVAEDLERAQRSLQQHIRIAEREPDRQLRNSHASQFGQKVETLTGLSAQLRQSLLQLGNDVDDGAAGRAGARLKLELAGLQAWNNSYSASSGNGTTPA